MRDVVLIACRRGHTIGDVLDGTNRILEQLIDDDVEPDVWFGAGGSLALIHLVSRRADDGVRMHRSGGRSALVYTGYVRPGATDPAQVAALMDVGRGRLTMRDTPGGIAGYFFADAAHGTAYAWSSHAGVQGIFHTRGERCIAISNRPLLSHAIARESTVPSFSSTWARRVLVGGATLWDDTPYEGTWYSPPRSTLVVSHGVIGHQPHPVEIERTTYEAKSPEGIRRFLDESIAAIGVLSTMPRAELRLSGGKDSRYVAALLTATKTSVDSITHAHPEFGEGPLSAHVAAAVGLPHQIVQMPVATQDALLGVMSANLRKSDGLVAEARQLSYHLERPVGTPFIDGQAHHPRGGYRSPMTRDGARVRANLQGTCIGHATLVAPDIATERRQRIDALLDGWIRPSQEGLVSRLLGSRRRFGHPVEAAYWMYSDWRMTRWIQAAYLPIARERPLVWPCMDEGVLRAISELSIWDRNTEYAFFSALQTLSPALSRIPLYDSVWNFDRGGLGESPFPDGFEERNAPFPSRQPPSGAGWRYTPDRRPSLIRPLFRAAVRDMRRANEVRSWIDPHALTVLESDAPLDSLGVPVASAVGFMWKAVAVSMVIDGSWYPGTT